MRAVMRRILRRHRVGVLCVGAALVLVGVVAASVFVGTQPLAPHDVWAALTGRGNTVADRIVVGLRLPRALIAVVAGAMLAVAGALLQSVSRNTLVDASLVGVTSGAAFAVVATVSVVGSISRSGEVAVAAVGAFAAAGLVAALGWRRGTSPMRLVLSGVIVSITLSSLVSVLLVLDGELAGSMLRWVVGTLHARVWSDWNALWPLAVAGAVLTVLASRFVTTLWLGDEVSHSVGFAWIERGSWCSSPPLCSQSARRCPWARSPLSGC